MYELLCRISCLNPCCALELMEYSLVSVISPSKMIKMIITCVNFVAFLSPVISLWAQQVAQKLILAHLLFWSWEWLNSKVWVGFVYIVFFLEVPSVCRFSLLAWNWQILTDSSCLTSHVYLTHQRKLPWGREGPVWKLALVLLLRRPFLTSRLLQRPSINLLTTHV